MNDQLENVLTGEVIDAVPVRKRGFGLWPASRSASGIMEDAMLDAVEDHYSAMLAKSALEHTGALSMMEAQLGQMAPQGQERFRSIVDAYAELTVRRIGRR